MIVDIRFKIAFQSEIDLPEAKNFDVYNLTDMNS